MNSVMTEPSSTPPPSPNLSFPAPGAGSGPAGGDSSGSPRKRHWALWITLGVFALLVVGGVSWYLYNFHAFIRPVQLSQREQEVVKQKIDTIQSASSPAPAGAANSKVPDEALREANQVKVLSPEDARKAAAQEREERRTIVLTQREINGMLNYNTDLGQRLKFDLRPGYIAIQYVQPVPEDVAIVGGKTLRFSLDVSMNKVPGGKLEFKIQDVSIGGIPIPAAWLEMAGIQKNQDLIELIKKEMPAFEKFEQGIDYVDISSGQLKVRLAE